MATSKVRKKTRKRVRVTGGHPAGPEGRQTTGSLVWGKRSVAVGGNLVGVGALLVGAAQVVWLLMLTAGDVSISAVVADDIAGTRTIAVPFLLALLSMTGFFFGQFAVRGRWTQHDRPGFGGGSFAVELRPISVRLHILFLGLSMSAWVLVMIVPVVLEARGVIDIPEGGSPVEQFWFTVTVYGVVTGALTAMIAVSLLKKLTYNGSLSRHTSSIRAGSPSQRRWRVFSHIWRAELGIAGFGGAALGLSPLGVHLGSPAYGLGALAIGLAVMALATLVALNAWRSGLPMERVESYS